jgi:hypothetical protein
MAQPSVHGRFIWQELLTDDTAAAAAFYSKVIGWRVQPAAHADATSYSVFATEHGTVGGVTSLPDHARNAGARAHWLPYVGAENVDATAAKAERLGGKVLRGAADVENLGRYAVLADPQGATFGIYRPKNPSGSAAKSQPQRGEFAWQELASSDFEAAFRFYGDLFGWQALRRMEMGPAGTYLVFGRDGVQQGGIYKLSAQTPTPYWLSYVEVGSPEVAAEAARGAGGRVAVGPMDVPDGGRIAQLIDPAGVLFAVHAAGQPATAAGTSATASSATPAATAAASAKPAARRPAASARPAATARPAAPAHSAPAAPVAAAAARRGTSGSSSTAAAPAPRKAAPKKKSAKPAAKRTAAKAKRRASAKSARGGTRRPVRAKRAKAAAKSKSKRAVRGGRATGGRAAGKRAKRAAGAGRSSPGSRRSASRRGRAGRRR